MRRRLSLDAVPCEVLSHIVAFADAGHTLLRCEVTGRVLRDAVRRDESTLWSGALRRWRREGAALRSLGSPRGVYRAFCTKKTAPANIRDPYDGLVRPACPNEDRLAFIFCVDEYAGVARWTDVPDHLNRITRTLRWSALPHETRFEFEVPDHGTDWDDAVEIWVRTQGQLMQTLYVFDTQSLQCVALFSNIRPSSIEAYDGEVIASRMFVNFFRSSERLYSGKFFGFSDLERFKEDAEDRYEAADLCHADPWLSFYKDAGGVLHLDYAGICFGHSEFNTIMSNEEFRGFVVDVVQQTHARRGQAALSRS